jgi:sodium/bile acid cotransporter 7
MKLSFIKKNWFLFGILIAVALGFLIPDLGKTLNPSSITNISIVIVLFFITGLTLPSESIKKGISDIRLHLYIQLFIFLIVPLYFLLTSSLLKSYIKEELLIGIYALACLPTTVSSCIIFTQLSEGNVVATIINASFSNVIGTIISPLILSLLMKGAGQGLPVGEVVKIITDIILKIFIPFLIGQTLRIFIKEFAINHKKKMGIISNVLILIIIFFALSKAVGNRFLKENAEFIILPMIYLAFSQLFLVFISFYGAKLLKFPNQDIISVIYTAPQKTLAMGVPLLSIYFSYNTALLGIAIIPLLFFHPWQLFVAGIIKGSPLLRKLQTDDGTHI